MAEFKHMISVDWLEVFTHRTILIRPGEYVGQSLNRYLVEDTGASTRVFRSVYSIKRGDYHYATICFNPASSVIDPMACTLKLDNRLLYHQGYIGILYDIMYALQLRYKGVTRLDLCFDCNRLADGTSVPQFLHDLMFSPVHTAGHIYKVGSRRMSVECRRGAATGTSITAMRWGSRASNVCAYCYNKSLEMLECKIKPWIVEAWERNGLKHNVYKSWEELSDKARKENITNGTTDKYLESSVWRFEISIKSQGTDILNMADGELFRVSPEYFDVQERVEALWWVYVGKVLQFRKSEGQTNTRCYPYYYPFGEEGVKSATSMPINMNRFADTGRTELIVARTLDKLSTQYADLGEQYGAVINSCVEFLAKLAGYKKANARLRNSDTSVIRMTAEERISVFDGLLITLAEDMYNKKRSVCAESLYSFSQSLLDSLREAELRDWAELNENTLCLDE